MEHIWHKQYEAGVKPSIDHEQKNHIGEIIDESILRFSEKPAFHNMGKTLTYRQLGDMSKNFSSYLQNDLGLQKGDRVALMMPNILQYPVSLIGVLQAGMVAVNVNPLYTARELEHQLKDSGAKAIVIFANSAHVLEKVLGNTDVKSVIVTGIGDLLGFPKALIVNSVLKYVKKMVPAWSIPNAHTFMEVLAKGGKSKFKPEKLNRSDLAFLQYTGGTTGKSKGAELTHGNIVANIIQAKEWIKNKIEDGKEIIITPLPLYHIFSLTANCFVFSSIGAMNVLITNPRDMAGFIKELKNWKFTAFTGVNTLFNGLLNQTDFASVDFSSLKLTLGGGMAVQKAVAEKWQKITGVPLIEAYGLTETSPAACMNPMNLQSHNGYVGLPISSTKVVIRDTEGVDTVQGEIGEICIQGPQVMKGYWNRPEETQKVMTPDNFFKTGDLGLMNDLGFIKLVDRKKDMILVSGFNVYPNEIEEVVSAHAKVLESAAIGVADERSGELVKIFVVKKDESLTETELKDYCRENLTGYKVPKFIEFRKDLPKSNVGKVLRKELRD